jgi:hypothetical protein
MTVSTNSMTLPEELKSVRAQIDSLCSEVLSAPEAKKFEQIVAGAQQNFVAMQESLEKGRKISETRYVQHLHGKAPLEMSPEDRACAKLFKEHSSAAHALSSLPQHQQIRELAKREETIVKELEKLSASDGWEML